MAGSMVSVDFSVVFLGPTGCGKGTQAEFLLNKTNLGYISCSSLLSRSAQASGKLLNDWEVIQKISYAVEDSSFNHHIFDGFPRTVRQTDSLPGVVREDYIVINFDIDINVVTGRLAERLICESCRRPHKNIHKSCVKCDSRLIRRPDDDIAAALVKLEEYRLKTLPILDHPNIKPRLRTIDASLSEEEVENQILDILFSTSATAFA